jgi:hypothetical protein
MCSLLLLGSGAISLFPSPRSLLNDVAGGGAWSTTLHRLSGRPLLRQCSSSSSAVGNDPRWLSRILRRAQDGLSSPLPLPPQRCHGQYNSTGGVTSAPWAAPSASVLLILLGSKKLPSPRREQLPTTPKRSSSSSPPPPLFLRVPPLLLLAP